jgi:hypothetical protein
MATNKPKEENKEEGRDSKALLTSILKEYKEDHYNFDDSVDWKISSGSLLLDLAIGSISPSLIRICGANNEGKTPISLEIVRQMFLTVPNTKCLWVISEGRGLTEENKNRCGLKFVYKPEDWEVGTIFVLQTNIYEMVINTIKILVKQNKEKVRYAFCIDSLDGLILREDSKKEINETNKVCGPQALSKKMLQSLSLGMFKFGHLMIILSQVTAAPKIDPYAKVANRGGEFSGGNALLHASDLILELQPSYASDYILDNPKGKMKDGKSKSIGKNCKITLQKVMRESYRKTQITYPVKFGRTPSGVWTEREIGDIIVMYELIKMGGAGWMTIDADFSKEIEQIGIKDFPEKIQGMDNLYKELESRPDLVKYLFDKFKLLLG